MIFRTLESFVALQGLQRALESTRISDWFGDRTSSRGAFPRVNVFRKGDDLVLVAEIPGADKSKIDIQVKNRQVRICGYKSVERQAESSVHRRERSEGEFDRVITLPAEIDAEGVTAQYCDGILSLSMPRAATDRARSVTVS